MKTDTNQETEEPQVDDSTGLTRRASMGLLGAAGLGALTGAAAATPPEGRGSQPFYHWEADVDAQGHDLGNVGTLVDVGAIAGAGSVTMADNATTITDFAGDNLEIDGSGVLHARVPTAVGGLPFVEDGSFDASNTTDVTYTLAGGPYTRVWVLIETMSFSPTDPPSPRAGPYEFVLSGINGFSGFASETSFATQSVYFPFFLGLAREPEAADRSGIISIAGSWSDSSTGAAFRNIDFGPTALDFDTSLARSLDSPLTSITFSVVRTENPGDLVPASYPFDLTGRVFGL